MGWWMTRRRECVDSSFQDPAKTEDGQLERVQEQAGSTGVD
jgi:hypothetical protein